MEIEYPDIVQIEPTNQCNFNCIMCIRRFWQENMGFMDFSLYKKLAKSVFPHIKRVVLYGHGEPLFHPEFINMARLTRELLPETGTIFFSTNGSLLDNSTADKLVKEIGVDSIAVSIDTTDFAKLREIRVGAKPNVLLGNIKYLAKIKKNAKRDFKLGIETVIMRSNLNDLIATIETAAEIGVDFISISHLVPYSMELASEIVYTTISAESLEISHEILKDGWQLVLGAVYEVYSLIYGDPKDWGYNKKLKKMWKQANEQDIEINPPLLLRTKEKLDWIQKIKKIFSKASKVAEKHGIKLELPNITPKEKARSCPYVDKNATIVRWDGEVVPCFNYMYTHKVYVNNHMKTDYAVTFGNIKERSLIEIWNSKEYRDFRDRLRRMSETVPYCGNCPYSSNYCWYTLTNEVDCYQNSPSCSECLYSTNLVKCLL